MPDLPEFTLTIDDFAATVTGADGLEGVPFAGTRVKVSLNWRKGDLLVHGVKIRDVPPVWGKIDATGKLVDLNGNTGLKLVAQDPAFNLVDGVSHKIAFYDARHEGFARQFTGWAFPAGAEGATVDLSSMPRVIGTMKNYVQGPPGTGGPGGGGPITAAQITDATAVGRDLIKATNAGAARTAIGAVAAGDVTTAVNAAVTALVDGAPGDLDTIRELAEAMGDNADFLAALNAAVAARAPKNLTWFDNWAGRANGSFPTAAPAASGQNYIESYTPSAVARARFQDGWLTSTDTATAGASSFYVFEDMGVGNEVTWIEQPIRFAAPLGSATAICIAISVDTLGGVYNVPVHLSVQHNLFAVQTIIANNMTTVLTVPFSGGSIGTAAATIAVGHDKKNGVVYIRDPFGKVTRYTHTGFLTGGRFAFIQIRYSNASTDPRAYLGEPKISSIPVDDPLVSIHPTKLMERLALLYSYADVVLNTLNAGKVDKAAGGQAIVADATASNHAASKGQLDAASTADRSRANHTGQQTSATISDFTEAVQDAVGALLGAGDNVIVNYDDANNTLTISAVGGGTGGLTVEDVRDAIGVAMVGVGAIAVTYNDALDTITISTTATANATDAALRDRSTHTGTQPADSITETTGLKVMTAAERSKLAAVAPNATQNATDAALRDRSTHTGQQTSATISDFTEAAQDAVAAMLAGASGVTVSYDDAGNTLTISGGGSGGLDAEAVRDAIGVALVAVGNISVVVNDAADTITISTTATQNSTDAALRDRSTHTGTQAIDTVAGLQAQLDGFWQRGWIDGKGDLLVGSGNDALVRVPVGADGQVLTADSAQAGGVKWATPAGGNDARIVMQGYNLGTGSPGPYTLTHNWGTTEVFGIVRDNITGESIVVEIIPAAGANRKNASVVMTTETWAANAVHVTLIGVIGTSDVVSPTQPTLNFVSKSDTTISVSTTAATDANGIRGYDYYRGGVKVGSLQPSTYTYTGLTPGTPYTDLNVIAIDYEGNPSAASANLSVTTDAPPTVTYDSAKPGTAARHTTLATTKTAAPTITVDGTKSSRKLYCSITFCHNAWWDYTTAATFTVNSSNGGALRRVSGVSQGVSGNGPQGSAHLFCLDNAPAGAHTVTVTVTTTSGIQLDVMDVQLYSYYGVGSEGSPVTQNSGVSNAAVALAVPGVLATSKVLSVVASSDVLTGFSPATKLRNNVGAATNGMGDYTNVGESSGTGTVNVTSSSTAHVVCGLAVELKV